MAITISNKITLNNKQYHVTINPYNRQMLPPKTVRRGVTGKTLISVGEGDEDRLHELILYVSYAPSTGMGSLDDLHVAANAATVSYTDHITAGEGETLPWGGGVFNVTIESPLEVIQLGPRPEAGYLVRLKMKKVL